eukprot:TRINITY_DN162_c0_g1_i4.p1 TRINITY_DN162_c0_g1~~TRINITY_DN162_c0_g1_i4.p1  ORF type:complete len:192 (-),score=16.52 TRINITY_DN162_c0_g1_i4:387-962(-)
MEPVIDVFGRQFCPPYEVVLKLREKLLSVSGDDMNISDVSDNVYFKLKASVLTVTDRRSLYDANDIPICSMQAKFFSMHHTFFINRGGTPDPDAAIFTVKKRMISVLPTFDVHFTGNESGEPDAMITGGLLERKFSITSGSGVLLAEASREAFSMENVVLGKETYFVRIQPGVDMAFIVSLICVVEEVLEG